MSYDLCYDLLDLEHGNRKEVESKANIQGK